MSKLVRRADRIICVSDAVARSLGAEKYVRIYNPFGLTGGTGARQIILRQNLVIGSVSSLLAWKGIGYFIKSYCLLDPELRQRTKYEIYGDGPLFGELKGMAKSVDPTEEAICLKGFVPFEEIAKRIDILVLPSIAPEGCPMVVIEANSAGIPVITTNIGGQSELIRDGVNGFLVPVGDSRAIAEKIGLLSNPVCYERLSRGAIEGVKRFDPEKFKAAILGVFQSLYL
jgi:glycosyltransferase involved in cell wall biosynthesis